MPSNQVAVGVQNNPDSSNLVTARGGKQGDQIASELHGRFYEQAYRGFTYGAGSSLTALSANTISLSATTTPIVGVWNPSSNGVNLVLLQAGLQLIANAATATAPGGFVWAASFNNPSITTGAVPINRKTLQAGGSNAKAFNGTVALTGLTNNLVILEGADFVGLHTIAYAAVAATAFYNGVGGVQNFDGQIIVPPGGVIALLNTVSTTTFSATSRLLWEEVPV